MLTTLCALELLGSCPPHLESQCVTVEGGHCVLEAHLVRTISVYRAQSTGSGSHAKYLTRNYFKD